MVIGLVVFGVFSLSNPCEVLFTELFHAHAHSGKTVLTKSKMAPKTIVIIGGLDCDMVMVANRIPDSGESLLTKQYLEALGGKGAVSAISIYRTCHKSLLVSTVKKRMKIYRGVMGN